MVGQELKTTGAPVADPPETEPKHEFVARPYDPPVSGHFAPEAPPEEGEDVVEDDPDYGREELKEELRALDLPTSGNKDRASQATQESAVTVEQVTIDQVKLYLPSLDGRGATNGTTPKCRYRPGSVVVATSSEPSLHLPVTESRETCRAYTTLPVMAPVGR